MSGVEGLASLALERDMPTEGISLLAATSRPRAELAFGENYFLLADELRAHTLDTARAKLGETAFAVAWAEGEALSVEDAADAAALIH
jgi:hypothetical protein